MVRGKTTKTNKEWELAKTLIPVMSGERWALDVSRSGEEEKSS
jgi:hypothetical protein